jgi:hypothetical protein
VTSVAKIFKSLPQRLKPPLFGGLFGPAEALSKLEKAITTEGTENTEGSDNDSDKGSERSA